MTVDVEAEPDVIFRRRRHARPGPADQEPAPAGGALRAQHVLAMTGAAMHMAEGSAQFLSAVRELNENWRKSRLWIWILSAVSAVLLVVCGTVVYLAVQQRHINAQLQATIVQLQAVQDRTSNQVLCPFFKIFVVSFTPAARAKQPPDTLPAYDNAVTKIETAYATLGCLTAPSPPAAR